MDITNLEILLHILYDTLFCHHKQYLLPYIVIVCTYVVKYKVNMHACVYPMLYIFCLVTPTITLEVMDQVQDEGGTASFTCQATSEPVPTISWYFNSTLLVNGTRHTISETSVNTTTISSTLTIMSVESSDVGTYACNATNVVSSDTSSGVLTVNGEL